MARGGSRWLVVARSAWSVRQQLRHNGHAYWLPKGWGDQGVRACARGAEPQQLRGIVPQGLQRQSQRDLLLTAAAIHQDPGWPHRGGGLGRCDAV